MQTQTITGIGSVNINYSEYTDNQLLDSFTGIMNQLGVDYTAPPNEDTYGDIVQQIGLLQNLAKNGINVSTGSGEYTAYFTPQMAQSTNEIMQTLAFAGIPTSDPNEQATAVSMWQSLQNFGVNVSGLLTTAQNLAASYSNAYVQVQEIDPSTGLPVVNQSGAPVYETVSVAMSPSQTFQSMLEIDYVGTGNTVIGNQLSSMEQALSLSNTTLNTLQDLQTLINNVNVSAPSISFSHYWPPNWPIPLSTGTINLIASMAKKSSAPIV